MLVVYLPKTDETQFLIWLNTYCRQKSASDIEPGMMVLVTPSESDASHAAFIVILPPPPMQ